jgi:transaldolase
MSTSGVDGLRTKIFADGADLAQLLALAEHAHIRGFTTNPTLMRKAGVTDYEGFARQALERIRDRPISFEVFSDDRAGMRAQALEIAGWGENVYVKIPVTTTRGESMADLVRDLSASGVQVNVTALMTVAQVETMTRALEGGAPSNISVFAGRIADTGRDPVPLIRRALEVMRAAPCAELIWASPRELLNVVQAHELGCHIITVTHDLLAKLHLLGKDLDEFSLDTVRMFHDDARRAGYRVESRAAARA